MYKIKAIKGDTNVSFNVDDLINESTKEINNINSHNKAIKSKVKELALSYKKELEKALKGSFNEEFIFTKDIVKHQNWCKLEIGSGLARVVIQFSTERDFLTKKFNSEIEGEFYFYNNWLSGKWEKQTFKIESVGQILLECKKTIQGLILIKKHKLEEINFETYQNAINKIKY